MGVGATPYYKRGGSLPKSITELAGEAILAAVREHALGRSQSDDITIVCFERSRG